MREHDYLPLIDRALAEDLGDLGDVTTEPLDDYAARACLFAKAPGVLAGAQVFAAVFGRIDPAVTVAFLKRDGDRLEPPEVVAEVAGSVKSILKGERTALNLLCYLSGIATATRSYVEAAAGSLAILDTRKTLPGFRALHPLQPEHTTQGILALMHDLLGLLAEITGMSWGTLQPFAGAHGEFAGMQLFRACFRHRGEPSRRKMLVPDSAHGTNPASAHLAGFEVVQLKSDARGLVSPETLREHLNGELAGIMMTNPNTLGLFERDICRVAELVHGAGGLLYYDGANLNAIVGKVRPGDMGFDVVHLNVHKTFSTPHGGGGPGAGPVLVNETLRPYLPVPDVVKRGFRKIRF